MPKLKPGECVFFQQTPFDFTERRLPPPGHNYLEHLDFQAISGACQPFVIPLEKAER